AQGDGQHREGRPHRDLLHTNLPVVGWPSCSGRRTGPGAHQTINATGATRGPTAGTRAPKRRSEMDEPKEVNSVRPVTRRPRAPAVRPLGRSRWGETAAGSSWTVPRGRLTRDAA